MGEITLKKIEYVFIFFIILGVSIVFYGLYYQYTHPEDTKKYTEYCKSLGFEDYYNPPSKDYSYNITSITCEKHILTIQNNNIIDRKYIKEEVVYNLPEEKYIAWGIIMFIIGYVSILFMTYAAANFYPDD